MYGHRAWETGGHLVGARLLLEKGTHWVARRWDPWYLTRYLVTILGSSGVPHWVFCIEVLRTESARRAYAYGFTSPTFGSGAAADPAVFEYIFVLRNDT